MQSANPEEDRLTAVPDAVTDSGREKRRVALVSVGAAVLLTGSKAVVGLLTGSLGLLAEAAHSGLDLVAAVITYFAVRVSDKPADADHLYGHDKVENLSALVETLLLLATCAWIVYEAIERLFLRDVAIETTVWSFVVIITSIIVDVSRSRALMRVARKHNSQALEADALHFSTDVWSSVVVLVGLILVRIGQAVGQQAHWLEKADATAALAVALLVVWVSLRLGRRTIDALLDRAPTGLVPAAEQAVRAVAGVLDCKQLRLRQSGNRTFVDVVIGVRRGLSVESSHAIGQLVEDRVRAVQPNADVVVHVEPMRGLGETLSERVQAIAVNQGRTVHNILISQEYGRTYVELHVEADENLDLRQAHDIVVNELEAAIRAELPEIAGITTHIEPAREPQGELRDVTAEAPALVETVQHLAAATPGIVECHDVTVRQSGRRLYLAMHCMFAPGLSIGQVHDLSSGLEQRLREAIPDVVRVTTHAEPVPDDSDTAAARG
jgi:cation diffusion facilitator family transporter